MAYVVGKSIKLLLPSNLMAGLGLLSLVSAPFVPIIALGIYLSEAILNLFVLSCFVLPAILLVFDLYINKFRAVFFKELWKSFKETM